MQSTNGSVTATRARPVPLRVRADMLSRWDDCELDFDTAAERIVQAHSADGAHHDLPILDLKTWAVTPHDGHFALTPLARHHEPKVLRTSAFSNLMARLGAPADFIRRLPAPLQLATTNYLLLDNDDSSSATLRLRGHEVAAIVSGRYAPLDPVELVETIRSSLARHGMLQEVRVKGVASGMVDNLRLVLPNAETAIRPGDVSALGIDITSSSFARSAVHVTPVIWRLVCSNGLKRAERGSGLSFRHVGDSQRLREAVSEAIPSAIIRARGVMDQWERAVAFMVDDVADQIAQLRELTVPERKSIESELIVSTGAKELPQANNLYDLLNAMTASAKLAPPARRLEIESAAGELLGRHVGGAS